MTSPRYLSGVVWSALNAAAGVLLPFATFIFFARTVPAAVIGAVALAVSISEILKGFGMPGLYEALLQSDEDRERRQQTAQAVMLGAGIVLAVVYLAILAAFARSVPDVAAHFWALATIGLRIVIDLATLQAQAELARRLSYRRLAMRALVGNTAAGALGVAVAFILDPTAGLILYQLGQSVLVFLTTVAGTAAMARPIFHRDCFRVMSREALLSSGVRLQAATINNLDQIIIAGLIGSTQLAFFNLGKRIENAFVTAAGSFSAILFQPLFATRGVEARHEMLARAIAVLTIILGLPIAVFLANSEVLVAGVFGRQWTAAAPVAAVLACNGFLRAVAFVPGALLSVSRRNRQLLTTSIASAAAGAALVFATAPFGVVWCAIALCVKQMLVIGWMSVYLREDVPRQGMVYAAGVGVTLALMLAGALAGRWLVGPAAAGAGAGAQFLLLALSALPALLAGMAYFLLHFRASLRDMVPGLRRRGAVG